MIEEGGSAEATDAWLRVVVALVDFPISGA
jgi:hypothetical protein